MEREYKVRVIRIGSQETRLYDLERQRNDNIEVCAKEWIKVLKRNLDEDHDFWGVAIPTALYDILEGWDTEAGIEAAKTFLEKQGYTIEKN